MEKGRGRRETGGLRVVRGDVSKCAQPSRGDLTKYKQSEKINVFMSSACCGHLCLRRVPVIGSPGAGTSTFARQVAALPGLPVTYLGAEDWRPDWVRPDGGEWGGRGYTRWPPTPGFRAAIPPWRCCCVPAAPPTGPHGAAPNLEFLRFIRGFPAVQRRQLAALEPLGHLQLVRPRSDRQARAWLVGLGRPDTDARNCRSGGRNRAVRSHVHSGGMKWLTARGRSPVQTAPPAPPPLHPRIPASALGPSSPAPPA